MKDKRCKCLMSISVLGDGCRYCQPQDYIDTLHHTIKDLDEEAETSAVLLEDIKCDLLLRADDLGSKGKVVNLSASIWTQLNKIIDES
jgi:hypothetical protein